jgi:hypothetical protein
MNLTSRGLVLVALAWLSGCAAYTRTSRTQQPFYQVDRPVEIALVSVQAPRWVMERAPSDFSNMRGIVAGALTSAFAGTQFTVVDKVDLGYTMAVGPKAPETQKIWIFEVQEEPTMARDQLYVAEAPVGLPMGVKQDLVLGVYVADWRMTKTNVGTDKKPQYKDSASVDLVYSLWTRQGKEVETRRVRTGLSPQGWVKDATSILPDREHAMSFHTSKDLWGKMAPMNRDELFRTAVTSNSFAFAFPYGSHEMFMTAQWDDTNDLVKPAVELAEKERFDDAYAAWKALADANPTLAPAVFNMGVVHEIKGQDLEALQLYEKAKELNPQQTLYERTRKALKDRLDQQSAIPLEGGAKPKAPAVLDG